MQINLHNNLILKTGLSEVEKLLSDNHAILSGLDRKGLTMFWTSLLRNHKPLHKHQKLKPIQLNVAVWLGINDFSNESSSRSWLEKAGEIDSKNDQE